MSELIGAGGDGGNEEAPKIEFPCDYPIKVLGRAAPDFEDLIVEVISRHTAPIDPANVKLRASGKGTFVSITVIIVATGVDQLDIIHKDLLATGRVQMVI